MVTQTVDAVSVAEDERVAVEEAEIEVVVLFENEKEVVDDGMLPEFVIGSTPLVTKMVDENEDEDDKSREAVEVTVAVCVRVSVPGGLIVGSW